MNLRKALQHLILLAIAIPAFMIGFMGALGVSIDAILPWITFFIAAFVSGLFLTASGIIEP